MSGSLEDAAAETNDSLVPGLSFQLPNAANYVNSRVFSTWFPLGSQYYSSTGTRLIRFQVSDQNMLDLSTVRLAFTIHNDAAADMWITGHPGMALFQRVRVYVGGCLAEDLLIANRTASMLDTLKPANRRWSEAFELFGQEDGFTLGAPPGVANAGPLFGVVRASSYRTVISPIFSGLLNTHWWLPLRHCGGITIELELVASAAQCCAATNYANPPVALSQQFHLENVRLLGDIVGVDNSVNEELSRVLLEGGALPMHFTSYYSTLHTLTLSGTAGLSWSVVLSRAFSRVKSIFVTFDSDGSRGPARTESNNFLCWHGRDNPGPGGVNAYNPAWGEGWRFQFSEGSLLVPQLPMGSLQEVWYQLSKLLGMASSLDGVAIAPGEWLANSFIIGLDMEKASATPGSGMASFSGISTRNAGDTMRFAFENVSARDQNSVPTRMYITLHVDLILEIRATGNVLLD